MESLGLGIQGVDNFELNGKANVGSRVGGWSIIMRKLKAFVNLNTLDIIALFLLKIGSSWVSSLRVSAHLPTTPSSFFPLLLPLLFSFIHSYPPKKIGDNTEMFLAKVANSWNETLTKLLLKRSDELQISIQILDLA